MPNCLKSSTPAIYADDTNVTITGATANDIKKILNDQLENVHQWRTLNKLTLNVDKTAYMIIGTYQKISKICGDCQIIIDIGEEKVKRVTSIKNLGVIIDDKLRWIEQIDCISTKV